ncbi:MAG: hypothetical protein HON70_18075, partial [Lentisphaerae bacterium]|nr:hypothetical protein [Lentisphaerota bacterium]
MRRQYTDTIWAQPGMALKPHGRLSGRIAVLVLVGSAVLRAGLPDTPTHTLTGLSCPYRLELEDFNQDGRTDLAVTSWHRLPGSKETYDHAKDKLQFFFARPDGTFRGPADHELNVRSPWGLWAGDFDRDGKTDLAVKQSRRAVHVLLGSEGLSRLHTSVTTNDSDRMVMAGRLSPGGAIDLLCGPAWRKWKGGDTFDVGYCYGPTANDNRGALIADLNHDGHNDMVFLTPHGIRVYYGPFTSMTVRPRDLAQLLEIKTPLPVSSVQIADLTGDGRADIVAALYDRKTKQRALVLYQQNAPLDFPGNPEPTARLDGVSGQLVTCDLNLDGRSDLLVADASKRRIHVLLQTEAGTFPTNLNQAHQSLKTLCYHLRVADINGDRFPDLAVSDGQKEIRFFVSDGVFARGKAPVPKAAGQPKQTARRTAAAEKTKPSKPAEAAPPTEGTADRKIAGILAALPPAEPGADHSDPLRMPFYTGTVLPTPQQAVYHDEFYTLQETGLLLAAGLEAQSPLVTRLRERIERFGGTVRIVDDASVEVDTLIVFGAAKSADMLKDVPAIPAREQAYIMACGKPGERAVIVLQGHDRLGLLWAVSSFGQLVHTRKNAPVVRAAEIVDYPTTPNRGFIGGTWVNGTDYCLTFKINKPVFQTALLDRAAPTKKARYDGWRQPLSDEILADLKAYGDGLTPYGIEWYAGHNPTVTDQKIRSADERDFQVILDWACKVAEFGGHLCLKYDDHRFPISSEDMERFGSAREADTQLLLRLHRELKARHPKAKILFCPPFYWGPNSPALYPEKRDDYLFALGSKLPEDIEIFWTGPRVKSGRVTADDVAWVTERL